MRDTRTTTDDRGLGDYLSEAKLLVYYSKALGKRVTIPDGLVSEKDACPSCGERDEDLLEWDEDGETVRCASCGVVYRP